MWNEYRVNTNCSESIVCWNPFAFAVSEIIGKIAFFVYNLVWGHGRSTLMCRRQTSWLRHYQIHCSNWEHWISSPMCETQKTHIHPPPPDALCKSNPYRGRWETGSTPRLRTYSLLRGHWDPKYRYTRQGPPTINHTAIRGPEHLNSVKKVKRFKARKKQRKFINKIYPKLVQNWLKIWHFTDSEYEFNCLRSLRLHSEKNQKRIRNRKSKGKRRHFSFYGESTLGERCVYKKWGWTCGSLYVCNLLQRVPLHNLRW